MTYSVSVHSKLAIDEKGTELREMDVNSDGYTNRGMLNEAIKHFKEEGVPETYESTPDWRKDLWYYLYFDFLRRLKRWRRYHL